MTSMNRVFLAGNLTRHPELKHTSEGQAVTDLGLAVTDRYRNREGEDVEQTCFAEVVVWGRQAETCTAYLKKGSPVLVEGHLQLDQWEADGRKLSRIKVRAGRVQFLGRTRQESSGAGTTDGQRNVKSAQDPVRAG